LKRNLIMICLALKYVQKRPFDRFFISRVEPGSPAESVGLIAGDEILSLDFKTISYYTLNELTELFRGHDGRQMLIEVVHHNERRIVVLKLKRRI
jgi:C-terminal processing protease CtpA/Prc